MEQNATTSANGALRQAAGAERERLLSGLRSAVTEAEQWLSSADTGSPDFAATQARFKETLTNAKTDLLKLEDSVLARGKLAAKSADTYVQDHPWMAVGVGAAVGLALGYLISRD